MWHLDTSPVEGGSLSPKASQTPETSLHDEDDSMYDIQFV